MSGPASTTTMPAKEISGWAFATCWTMAGTSAPMAISMCVAPRRATASVVSVDTEAAINTWNDKVVASLTHVDANDLDGNAIQAHLDDWQTAAGADGSVVVLNGHLTYDTSGLVVNDNQTLLGGGTTLRVRGAATGVEVDYVTAGAAGSV